MSKVIIFGTGDFAQVAAIYLEADSPHQVVGFTVDSAVRSHDQVLGKPVFAFENLPHTHPPHEYQLLVAIGFQRLNQARADVFHRCKAVGYRCISYVCSKAVQWGHVEVGENTFVFENNVLQPFVRIGDNSVLWSGNHIGHHARIGNHCFLTSHVVVSGGTVVGDYCFVGVNAVLGDHLNIAPRCLIGPGAMVLGDTREDTAYFAPASEPALLPASSLPGLQFAKRTA